jgi:hypothetical protein
MTTEKAGSTPAFFAFPGCSASGQDNYNHPGKREKHGVDKVTFSSTRTLR